MRELPVEPEYDEEAEREFETAAPVERTSPVLQMIVIDPLGLAGEPFVGTRPATAEEIEEAEHDGA